MGFEGATADSLYNQKEQAFLDANDLANDPKLKALVDAEIARELKSMPPPPASPAQDPRLIPDRPLFKVRYKTLAFRHWLRNIHVPSTHEPHCASQDGPPHSIA